VDDDDGKDDEVDDDDKADNNDGSNDGRSSTSGSESVSYQVTQMARQDHFSYLISKIANPKTEHNDGNDVTLSSVAHGQADGVFLMD
jgi:hypothetical protein